MRENLTIHQLMMEKLGGIISATDEAYLDHLIETDDVVAATWQQLQELYPAADTGQQFSRFDHYTWKDITAAPIPAPKRTVVPVRRLLWAAAAIILLIVSSTWYIINRNTQHRNSLAIIKNKAAGVRLQLANGEVVNLSKEKGTIKTAQAQLTNNNKTLSFALQDAAVNQTIPEINTLTVPVGTDYKIELSDGSEVWLNAASTLRFPLAFSGASREISIEGEAFLKIAADANRPFLVHTSRSTVQVLGTSFNINAYDSGIVKVSLVEGAVKMKAGTAEVSLTPGVQGVLTGSGISRQPFDETEVLSWREGLHYFSNATLADISKVLPRWFGVPVQMDNNKIANETFKGRIDRNLPITTFLDDLKSTTTVDYYFDQDGVLHFK